MDLFANLGHGLAVAALPQNLLHAFIGALIGTVIGVLPGIGAVSAVAMLLPVTFYLEPTSALIMLAGIYYGAQYGSSTTAILANLPGENSSIVTCLDGYQMARRGRAGPALAVAALGSLCAGLFATLFIALFAPPLAELALLFGPAEYFSLMILGLLAAVVLAQGSVLKAVGMIVLGLVLAMVGTDVESGALRMTMGIPQLADGIGIVPMAMGVFGIGEIIKNLENPTRRSILAADISHLWPTRDDFARCWKVVLRSSAVGSALGLLPGGGSVLSSFVAYSLEKKLSPTPERFGQGAVEGVAAPESANNAGAQVSFIPLLTLGIPSNGVMALMAGAMMIHGVQPGPQLMNKNPDIFWGLIASMLIGNIMLVIINLPLIRVWVMMLKVPYHLFYPMILVFCCIGIYTLNTSVFDVYLLLLFGLLGYVLAKFRCEPAPLLLAFVLGPMIEENMRRALQLSFGDPLTFVTRPISASLLLLAAGFLVLLLLPAFRYTRRAVSGDV